MLKLLLLRTFTLSKLLGVLSTIYQHLTSIRMEQFKKIQNFVLNPLKARKLCQYIY